MDPSLEQQEVTEAEPEGGQPGFCSRLKTSVGQPERLQPTILAISLTYIVYTISAAAGHFTIASPAIQFTYYCCIVGLASTLVFYLKFCINESWTALWLLIYNGILVLVVLLYLGYWFSKPTYKPLHLVLQIALIGSVVLSLLESFLT